MKRRPPTSTLFPYTTLFRSPDKAVDYLQMAADDGFPCYPLFANDELLKTISHDPRFVADRKSTRLNSSHPSISYAVFCLKKKIGQQILTMANLSTDRLIAVT